MARIRSIKPDEWKSQQEPWGHARSNLYIIQEGTDGWLKIGIGAHPTRRLSTLQCGNHRPLWLRAVYEGTAASCRQVEQYALRFFRADAGEWIFADLHEVLKFISAFEGDAE